MQKVRLVPDAPFATKLDIAVYTIDGESEKKRCGITAEFARGDIEQLKNRIWGLARRWTITEAGYMML